MVRDNDFKKEIIHKQKVFIIQSKIISDDFYREVENTLCKGFKSGRNLDALLDILRGGFTNYLNCTYCSNTLYNLNENCQQCNKGIKIILINSKILRPKILEIFKIAAKENKFLIIEFQ